MQLYTMNSQKVLVRKPDGKIQIYSPRRKWKDNIKVYFREKWDKW